MALVAASTHPTASWTDQQNTDKERYQTLTEDFQALARRQVISGMHIHAEIEDEDLRIDLMNQVGYFLPHLLALSTSSPFWAGQDTGLKAFRRAVAGDLPRSGSPETVRQLARVAAPGRDPDRGRADRGRDPDLVGHPPLGQASDAGAADHRHLHRASRMR